MPVESLILQLVTYAMQLADYKVAIEMFRIKGQRGRFRGYVANKVERY